MAETVENLTAARRAAGRWKAVSRRDAQGLAQSWKMLAGRRHVGSSLRFAVRRDDETYEREEKAQDRLGGRDGARHATEVQVYIDCGRAGFDKLT